MSEDLYTKEDAIPMAKVAAAPVQCRVTLTGTLYHQQHNQQPTEHALMYVRPCAVNEQAWARSSVAVCGQPAPVGFGWLQGGGVAEILIQNTAGIGPRKVNPHPDELAIERSRVLRLRVDGVPFVLGAGQVMIFQPEGEPTITIEGANTDGIDTPFRVIGIPK